MESAAPPSPKPRANDTGCPDRIEVMPDDRHVSAAIVKAWVTHLRSHGWTDTDLPMVWLMRARQGVTR